MFITDIKQQKCVLLIYKKTFFVQVHFSHEVNPYGNLCQYHIQCIGHLMTIYTAKLSALNMQHFRYLETAFITSGQISAKIGTVSFILCIPSKLE